MIHPVQPVILCGGTGTRLWPLSRAGFPKQFLCLSGTESLFQQAVQRLAKHGSNPYIVSNEEHRFLAQEQLREIGFSQATYLLEPAGRNTAPALTLAALAARDAGSDPVLVVTPADQIVRDGQAFDQALQTAISDAAKGHIVILGVVPDKPETGYGYIQVDDHYKIKHDNEIQSQEVLRFVEKPDFETAQKYISEGKYFWNAGMFVLKASVYLSLTLSY